MEMNGVSWVRDGKECGLAVRVPVNGLSATERASGRRKRWICLDYFSPSRLPPLSSTTASLCNHPYLHFSSHALFCPRHSPVLIRSLHMDQSITTRLAFLVKHYEL